MSAYLCLLNIDLWNVFFNWPFRWFPFLLLFSLFWTVWLDPNSNNKKTWAPCKRFQSKPRDSKAVWHWPQVTHSLCFLADKAEVICMAARLSLDPVNILNGICQNVGQKEIWGPTTPVNAGGHEKKMRWACARVGFKCLIPLKVFIFPLISSLHSQSGQCVEMFPNIVLVLFSKQLRQLVRVQIQLAGDAATARWVNVFGLTGPTADTSGGKNGKRGIWRAQRRQSDEWPQSVFGHKTPLLHLLPQTV